MNIKLQRIKSNGRVVDGVLKIHGVEVCHTAENAIHCCVKGIYSVGIHYCKHYRRRMLVLTPYPDTSTTIISDDCEVCPDMNFVCQNTNLSAYCPMIKPGNGAYNRTDGSILVGERVADGCLIHPYRHYIALLERVRKVLIRKHPVFLIIE